MFDALLPDSVSIVLVKTSHPGNVGSVARAMKTMGLSDLRLVSPRFEEIASMGEAITLASGAVDVLESSRVYSNLPDALEGVSTAYALSARIRELGPTLSDPAQASRRALVDARNGLQSAFVFGAERTGLTNDELLCCNRHVFIPSSPVYSSLNLSQAVQIIAYSLRLSFSADSLPESKEPVHEQAINPASNLATKPSTKASYKPASRQAVLQLQEHWLQAMASVDFLNPEKPKKLVQRLSRMLGRSDLEQEEVDMLRGFLADVIRVSEGKWYPHEKQRLQDKLRDE